MDPRVKGRLLWGLVGLLSFLVLVQGFELTSGQRVDWVVKFGVAVAVGVVATATVARTRDRLRRIGRR